MLINSKRNIAKKWNEAKDEEGREHIISIKPKKYPKQH
jgi:hypothetical protein